MNRIVARIILIVLACAIIGIVGYRIYEGKLFVSSDAEQTEAGDEKIIVVGNHLTSPEATLNEVSVEKAISKFERVRDKYLATNTGRIYMSVIPDKEYYIAKDNDIKVMDYDNLFAMVQQPDWYTYIDITDTLETSDYYYTDNHWKQECIIDTAGKICQAMGADAFLEKELVSDEVADFVGVYQRESGIKTEQDKIVVLRNEIIDNCAVTNTEDDMEASVYDFTKKDTDNTYDIYLSGAKSVEYVKNSSCNNGKKLIVFRDSFGSAIVPLLVKDYSEVVLVDLRFIMTDLVENYVSFDDADILFIYSSSVLNRSSVLR